MRTPDALNDVEVGAPLVGATALLISSSAATIPRGSGLRAGGRGADVGNRRRCRAWPYGQRILPSRKDLILAAFQ